MSVVYVPMLMPPAGARPALMPMPPVPAQPEYGTPASELNKWGVMSRNWSNGGTLGHNDDGTLNKWGQFSRNWSDGGIVGHNADGSLNAWGDMSRYFSDGAILGHRAQPQPSGLVAAPPQPLYIQA